MPGIRIQGVEAGKAGILRQPELHRKFHSSLGYIKEGAGTEGKRRRGYRTYKARPVPQAGSVNCLSCLHRAGLTWVSSTSTENTQEELNRWMATLLEDLDLISSTHIHGNPKLQVQGI